MSRGLLVLMFFIFGIVGCTKNNSSDAEIPNGLFSKFPELKHTNDSSCRLIRSVYIAEVEVDLKLFKLPDDRGNLQKIVVVTNKGGERYAIPFFSNFYRNYWGYDDANLQSSFPTSNTTFESEYRKCLSTLKLDAVGRVVFKEMMFSLLHCQKLNGMHAADLPIYMVENSNYPYETTDSCFQRMKRDWEKIVSRLYPPGYTTVSYPVYQDVDNKRIYQLIDSAHFLNNGFSLIVYRTDCNEALLYL